MEFQGWFKKGWWALLTVALSSFLWARLHDLLLGEGKATDIVAFAVWGRSA